MLTSLYQSDAPVSEIYEAYGDYSNMKWEGLTGFNLTITLGLTCWQNRISSLSRFTNKSSKCTVFVPAVG